MPIEQVFLGYDRPLLSLGLEYLVDRFSNGDRLALDRLIIAVPGRRAGDRLLERLVDWAEENRVTLSPPEIVTVGRLPELLYVAKNPFADNLVQTLAWIASMQRLEPDRLAHLLPEAPEKDNLAAWIPLGQMVARLHRELAAEALNFKAVLSCGDRLTHFPKAELTRWQVLRQLQEDYLKILDRNRLWDLQTARLRALENREYQTDRPVLLFGTVDLNRAQQKIIEQIASQATALVFAPESSADKFDQFGCLKTGAWESASIDIDSDQIDVVDSPSDQALAVAGALSKISKKRSAEEITIGVPDARLVPYIEGELAKRGVKTRFGIGRSVLQTEPALLISSVAQFVQSGSFSTFASFIRRPSIQDWLESRQAESAADLAANDWLSELDRFQNERIADRIDLDEIPNPNEYPRLATVFEAIGPLLLPFKSEARPLSGWSNPLADWLIELFGHRPLSPKRPQDRAILKACEAIREVLVDFQSIPAELMPNVTASEAIGILFGLLSSKTVGLPPERDSIEMVGWLELPMDDAPDLIVTGMNEGIVPSVLNADLFLPNRLREALGIEDNRRRRARDTYALTVLLNSRPGLRLIAGRRSSDGDPLTPSRLLLACDPETVARRVVSFFDRPTSKTTSDKRASTAQSPNHSRFVVPRPERLDQPVSSMRVTEFRDYLACPYRYYLRHRLGLVTIDDQHDELDGAAFGSLAHAVLDQFGRGELADCEDAEAIKKFCLESLDQLVESHLGTNASATVLIQIEQLRLRLAAFAEQQASWAADGWRIEAAEVSPKWAELIVDSNPIGLRGRIDRIDINHRTGRIAILDYKTSDTAKSPKAAHQKKDAWIDLQLPLYRHLLAGLDLNFDPNAPIDLGYVNLPKNLTKSQFELADWSDADLSDADEEAARVVRAIRQELFWPPATPAPLFNEQFAAICLENQF
jgi:ATP-dependent helicase/nuclease subunit B